MVATPNVGSYVTSPKPLTFEGASAQLQEINDRCFNGAFRIEPGGYYLDIEEGGPKHQSGAVFVFGLFLSTEEDWRAYFGKHGAAGQHPPPATRDVGRVGV